MKTDSNINLQIDNLEATPLAKGSIILNKDKFVQVLDEIEALGNIYSYGY